MTDHSYDGGLEPMNTGPTQSSRAAQDSEILIEGQAGQIINFWHFIFSAMFCAAFIYLALVIQRYAPPSVDPQYIHKAQLALYGAAVLSVVYALYRYLAARMERFWVTRQRLKQRVGVLNFRRKNLELYRVKDVEAVEPFLYRLFGVGDIFLVSSDRSDPLVKLKGIRKPGETADRLRDLYEQARLDRGVREID